MITVLFFLALSAYYDAKETKIPNRIMLVMIIMGFIVDILRTATGHMPLKSMWLYIGVSIVILAVGLFTPLMGGGDAKLLCGLCLFAGPAAVLQTFLLAHLAIGFGLINRYIYISKVSKNALKDTFGHMGKIPMAPAFFLMYAAYVMCPVTQLFKS